MIELWRYWCTEFSRPQERRQRPQENEEIASGEERLSTFDKRLISVAVTLLILRLPSLIIDIAVLATPSEQVPEIFHTTAMAAGVFLAVSWQTTVLVTYYHTNLYCFYFGPGKRENKLSFVVL